MTSECPACYRGTIIDGHCGRCGIFVARGAEAVRESHPKQPRRLPDQSEVGHMTLADYARTKEDKL